MAVNDMKHLVMLPIIAKSDVDVLNHKEATYRGSWKRAGGRSAWFMARRNMDRLIAMMAPPPAPDGYSLEETVCAVQNAHRNQGRSNGVSNEHVLGVEHMRDLVRAEDIFAKIEEFPKGDDGTVLACLRDLRRYLLLVEAEMVSNGVVEPEVVPVPLEDSNKHALHRGDD